MVKYKTETSNTPLYLFQIRAQYHFILLNIRLQSFCLKPFLSCLAFNYIWNYFLPLLLLILLTSFPTIKIRSVFIWADTHLSEVCEWPPHWMTASFEKEIPDKHKIRCDNYIAFSWSQYFDYMTHCGFFFDDYTVLTSMRSWFFNIQ